MMHRRTRRESNERTVRGDAIYIAYLEQGITGRSFKENQHDGGCVQGFGDLILAVVVGCRILSI